MNTTKSSVATIVTERIIAALQTGVAPWRKPWATSGQSLVWASNLVSGKAYNGCNQFLLQLSGYSSPYWLTYKQAAALGGQVRKGEKGTPVIYVGRAIDKKAKPTKDGSQKGFSFLKYYVVFNVAQVDGLGDHVPAAVADTRTPHQRLAAAEALFAGYKDAPPVREAEAAWYHPVLDQIGIPALDRFDTAASYYATLFHEAIHSTGHPSRLNREGVNGEKVAAFGSETYGKEELVAELGAAFLCAEAGIDNVPASASYCKSWITTLKGDHKLVIAAAAAAQKAYRYIHPETASAEETDAADE